jgi:4-amino-4-deoxy-L-arabinose transferase-like glycosyltransferase
MRADAVLHSRVLKGLLAILVLCFSFLRIVNLNADFPSGITTSGVLYTDEGWYAAAATRHILTGHWYLASDINTAVLMPVGQVLHRISFALFGLSLSSSRITIVISFFALTMLTALLVRRSFGDYAGLLAALLLTTNYIAFAYSRLATMDLVATNFVVASFYVAGGLKNKTDLKRLLAASLLMAAGILTKTNSIFGIPILAYIAWQGGSNKKEQILFVGISMLVVMGVAGGYLLTMSKLFPADFEALRKATSAGFYTNLKDWLIHIPHAFLFTYKLGIGFVSLAGIFTMLALLVSPRFRKDPLVYLLIGYMVIYYGLLSLDGYRPPRYYLPLLVPMAALSAIACATLAGWLSGKRRPILAVVPVLLIASVCLQGSRQIITYLRNPSFSYYQMMHSLGDIIQEREGRLRGVLLYGDASSSVALETGVNAINNILTADPAAKIREYQPKYVLVHTSTLVEDAAASGGVATELGRWDVYGNYYGNHQPMRLYLIDWSFTGTK